MDNRVRQRLLQFRLPAAFQLTRISDRLLLGHNVTLCYVLLDFRRRNNVRLFVVLYVLHEPVQLARLLRLHWFDRLVQNIGVLRVFLVEHVDDVLYVAERLVVRNFQVL